MTDVQQPPPSTPQPPPAPQLPPWTGNTPVVPPQAPQQPRPGNGPAIAGFTIGIVSLLGGLVAGGAVTILLALAGVILSAVGIALASKGRSGRGLAIAGVVLSAVALLAAIGHASGSAGRSVTAPSGSGYPSYSAPSYSAPTTAPATPPIPTRTYSGSGDDVVKLDKPTGIAITTFSCPKCSSNTIVNGDGSDYGLVNTIGSYTGKRWIDERDNTLTTQLTVKAHGKWTLTISDLSQIRRATGPISGHGDDVVALTGSTSTATITNRGQSNFIVHTITSSGDIDGAVNEIGSYSGTVPLQAPALVEVQSSGDWTITPN